MYIIAYSAGLAIVVIYFIVRVQGAGYLNQQFAHSACYPFFKDHTSLALQWLLSSRPGSGYFQEEDRYGIRTDDFRPSAALCYSFVLSYSRAAWVSLIAASPLPDPVGQAAAEASCRHCSLFVIVLYSRRAG